MLCSVFSRSCISFTEYDGKDKSVFIFEDRGGKAEEDKRQHLQLGGQGAEQTSGEEQALGEGTWTWTSTRSLREGGEAPEGHHKAERVYSLKGMQRHTGGRDHDGRTV